MDQLDEQNTATIQLAMLKQMSLQIRVDAWKGMLNDLDEDEGR